MNTPQITSSLLLFMAAHVFWSGMLYALLTAVRAPDIWRIGLREDGSNPLAKLEPKISANLKNQFEWPMFFHLACIVAIMQPQLEFSSFSLWAWLFIIGRALHSVVHIFLFSANAVRVRGLVFILNFIAVCALWVGLVNQHFF